MGQVANHHLHHLKCFQQPKHNHLVFDAKPNKFRLKLQVVRMALVDLHNSVLFFEHTSLVAVRIQTVANLH